METDKSDLSFKDRDLKTLVSMLEAEVTGWDKRWKGPFELKPVPASASSSGTEGWSFGEKRYIDLILEKKYSQHWFRPISSGYYCAKYFSERVTDDDSFRWCLREIEKLSLIELEPAESMEELREAVRETKEKSPDARLVNAPEEHRVDDPDYVIEFGL